MDNPKVIVVAEPEVHDLLARSGVQWDVQHPVASVAQLWDDLGAGRLDQRSVAIVFSDRAPGGPGDLERAVATMAAHAATFVVAWDTAGAPALLARVRDTATAQGGEADAPVHLLPTTDGRSLLDGLRRVLADAAPPRRTTFPAEYAGAVDGPIGSSAPAAAPAAPAVPPAAATREPTTLAPAPAPTPIALAPVVQVDPPADGPTEGRARAADPLTDPLTDPVPAPSPAPVAVAPAEDRAPESEPAGAPESSWVRYAPAQFPTPYQEQAPEHEPLPGQVTMAVTSSKGGSGKSTIAMLIAAQIAHSSRKAFEQGLVDRPQRVVLVDMDTRDGQVASLVGQYIPTALNIRVSPSWDEETVLANLVHDDRLGIDALLAPVRPRTADDVGPDFYRHVIRTLQRTHDVVVMDTSVNYLDPLISTVCLPEATAILFVTTLATTSVQGMARALQEITQTADHGGMGIPRTKIGVVVNQAVEEVGMERDQVLQAALKVPMVGSIPLATRDVLTCTNFNRMHRLLEHPSLGPAYFKLAEACLPGVPLLPVVDEAPRPAGRRIATVAADAGDALARAAVPVPSASVAPVTYVDPAPADTTAPADDAQPTLVVAAVGAVGAVAPAEPYLAPVGPVADLDDPTPHHRSHREDAPRRRSLFARR